MARRIASRSLATAAGEPPEGLRPVRIEPGAAPYAEGSALIAQGDTRVLCAATVENRVPDFLRGRGRGWVTAEYAMLPRATLTRSPRERSGAKPNARALEISRLVGRALRAAVRLDLLGERTVTVDCDVLQADGGTRCAAITGGMAALALALRRLAADPESGVPAAVLSTYVSAVSVGIVDGRPRLDLRYADDSRADVDMNVAMTADGRYVEIQGSAEGAPFTERQLSALRKKAAAGCAWLCARQRAAVEGAEGAAPR